MKDYFTDEELDYFTQIFMKKKLSILNEKVNLKKNTAGAYQSGDIVDMATELLEREMDIILTRTEKKKLKEIEDSLERIKNKTYGICIDTGEKINIERLKAVPEAKRSIKAQELYDKKNNLQKKMNREQEYKFD